MRRHEGYISPAFFKTSKAPLYDKNRRINQEHISSATILKPPPNYCLNENPRPGKIRMSNIQIRNKSECSNFKITKATDLQHDVLDFCHCLGFRTSGFGFSEQKTDFRSGTH